MKTTIFQDIITLILLGVFAFHLFGWSARTIDMHWCHEAIVSPGVDGSNTCDPPSKITYDIDGKHWVCRCPR